MKSIFVLIVFGAIFIDQIGDKVSIINNLGPNPPSEVIIEGINYTGDFIDIMEFTPTTPSDTIDIALNSIPLRTDNGVQFFEFMLRLNETGGPNNFAKMAQMEIIIDEMNFFRLVETSLGSGNGSLGFGEGIFFSDFGPGNNQADASIKLPLDLFNGMNSSIVAKINVTLNDIEAGADFISLNDGTYLPDGIINNPPREPNIPEPSRIILVMLGLFMIVVLRKRKNDS